MCTAPQNFKFEIEGEGGGEQNSGCSEQNWTKCEQNYGSILNSKFQSGGATCLQPPKFLIWNRGRRGVNKIRDAVNKIEQNVNKIMVAFWIRNSKVGGLHVYSPPNFKFEIEGEGAVSYTHLTLPTIYSV